LRSGRTLAATAAAAWLVRREFFLISEAGAILPGPFLLLVAIATAPSTSETSTAEARLARPEYL
jgi:hypothetical protein